MLDDYAEIYATLPVDETVEDDPGETIRRDTDLVPQTLRAMPTVDLSDADNSAFVVGRTLGEGGMGIVRAALQMPFDREVALKTLREGRVSQEGSAGQLLREAIATGRLEHPNVVPVYAVGQDTAGRPVIVMKRIEGSTWEDLLANPESIPGPDPLEWNLRTFMRVCSAVDFAHQNGILHRDIKPQNVMIGPHDDIYLVDWGLAVTTEQTEAGILPYAGDATQLCGTPGYMPPEMTTGRDPSDRRTDIYLLGATLHELVTGRPPHRGTGMYQVMLHAYASDPAEFGPDVAPELAAICHRAMAREREDRFSDVGELRRAVENFLRHRSAAELTARATEQLEELAGVLADDEMSADERRVAVYRLYGASRFGFEESLAEWPDQSAATAGLQRVLELMIRWELDHGSPHAAQAMSASLPEPRPALAAEIDTVEQSLEHEARELVHLRRERRERDVRIGAKTRALLILLFLVGGIFFPTAFAFSGYIDPADPVHFWALGAAVAVGAIVVMGLGWFLDLFGPRFARTRVNRDIMLSIVTICLWLIAGRGIAVYRGVSISTEFALELAAFAAFSAVVSISFDRRLLISSVAFAIGAAGATWWPQHALEYFVGSSALALTTLAVIWARHRRESPADDTEQSTSRRDGHSSH